MHKGRIYRNTWQWRSLSFLLLLTIVLSINENSYNNLISYINRENVNNEKPTTTVQSQGVSEIVNFIPAGTGSSHLYHSSVGNPLWTYPATQSYLDTYWGTDPYAYSNQSWNPENKYLQDSISQVVGSTDFNTWTDGVGTVRLDAARRDHTYRLNNPNSVYSLGVNGQLANPTGTFSSTYDTSSDNQNWGSPDTNNTHYPGNKEGSSGTDYLATNPSSFAAGTWPYGNTKNTPSRQFSSVDTSAQSYSVTAKRYTWYELYYSGSRTYDKVTAGWDTTFIYNTVFRLYFYYDNTTASTKAYYGAAITLTPISSTEIRTNFDIDISGSIQYDIFKNGTTPVKISSVSQTKTFQDSSSDGSFPSDASMSIGQSGNFGGSLTTDMYYFQILVNMTHHMYGTYSEISAASQAVSEYFAQEIGLTVGVSNPYVSISESTPINSQSQWGSTKIDPEYFSPQTMDIAHDTSTTGDIAKADGSFSHSLGYGSGNNRLLVVTVSWEDDNSPANVSNVKFNSVSMIRLADVTITAGTRTQCMNQWYLLDSNLPTSSGSYTVFVDLVASPTPSDNVVVGVSSYINVQQEAPYDVGKGTAVNLATISTYVDTQSSNSVLISSVSNGQGGSTFTHSGTGSVKRWEIGTTTADSAGGDKVIASAGTNNQDTYTYGASQARACMISASWGRYSAEIYQERSYQYVGAKSPNINNMKIENVHIYLDNAATIAVGIWTGGSLSNPTGATLLISHINVVAVKGWNEISLPLTSWPQNTITWIGFVTNGNGYVPYTTKGGFTNFAATTGAWNQTSPSIANPTSSMSSTIGAGAFLPIYYAVYIDYSKNYDNYSVALIESDWITWGENRYISSTSNVNMTFGYRIPSALRGYNGESLGLQYARIIANLTIEKAGVEYKYSQTTSRTFAAVRDQNLGYGLGCDKFSWNMNTEIKSVLNYSTRIKWFIGILLQPQFELGYNYSVVSQVYFNNINCTVRVERPIVGTFNIKDLEGNTENNVNISIYNEANPTKWYTSQTTSGTAVFNKLTLGTWRITINKTISGTGYTVIIFNSSRSITVEQDFTATLYCNLTNILFNVLNYQGNPMTAGVLLLINVANPSKTVTASISGTGNAFLSQIYTGYWRIIAKTSSNNVVMNFTRYIDSYSSEFLDSEKYFIQNAQFTTIQSNLTNIEFHVVDPTYLQPTTNVHISLTSQQNPSIFFSGYTNVNGNLTIREITAGMWHLLGYSVSNYVIFNQTNANIATTTEMQYYPIIYNLTNLDLQVKDYSGTLLTNSVSPQVILHNLDNDMFYQKTATNGYASFTELYNGLTDESWRLIVNVTYQSRLITIYNSSYRIATNDDLLTDTIQANRTLLIMTIYDRDSQIIPNAVLNFTETNLLGSINIVTTNSEGKGYVSGFYSSNWILNITYSVSGAQSLLSTDYTIYYENPYTISLSGASFITSDTISNCNLTTLGMYVLNHNVDRLWAGLYRANVTLQSYYTAASITTLLTNADGYVSIRLPADTYNFSIQYQGVERAFHFNDTGYLVDQYVHNKSISNHDITEMNITLIEYQTRLSLQELSFGVSGWNDYNGEVSGQSYQITVEPYYLYLYRNDSVEFQFFFEKLADHSGVVPDVVGSWNLTKSGLNVNSSSDLNSLYQVSGIYNLTLYTVDYSTGSYELSLEFGKINHLIAYYSITMNILAHTTKFERIFPLGTIKKGWHEDLVILANYTTLIPQSNLNITGATVTYSIIGTSFLNQPMTNPSGIYANTGVYALTLTKWSLNVGAYSMILTASKENFVSKTFTITFEITPVDTASSSYIDTAYRITSTYLKVAYGENFTVYANFTYDIPSQSNFSALVNVNFNAYLDTPAKPLVLYVYGGSGRFICTNYANLYTLGIHILYLRAEQANHESQIIQITIEIQDNWDSSVEVIENPYITPWANNATFIIEYSASESPRTQLLTAANITQLQVSYKQGGQTYILATLTSSSSAWGWTNLGNGQYQIWINTQIIEIVNVRDFYLTPSISQSIYKLATTQVVVWITPLQTQFTLTSQGNPVSLVNLNLDESALVNAYLAVTEPSSVLLGTPVNGAYASYTVYNVSDNEIVELGALTFQSGGNYRLSLVASKIGDFTVKITMSLNNYTLKDIASFSLHVGIVQAEFSISIDPEFKISDLSLKVAWGENISFLITYIDQLPENFVLTAKIGEFSLNLFYQGGFSYLCTYPASEFEAGNYIIYVTSTQQYASPFIENIELEILEFWETSLTPDPFDFTIVPWNNITNFSLTYKCIESPRDGILLENANITHLFIKNSQNQVIFNLTAENQGILWDWNENEYSIGEYIVWLNTSFLEIFELTAYFVTTYIEYDIYQPNTADSAISVRPVELDLTLYAFGLPLPSSVELGLNDNFIVDAYLEVSDISSVLNGKSIEFAQILYTISNDSGICNAGYLSYLGEGKYTFNVSTAIEGDFDVDLFLFYSNYSFVTEPKFTFYTGIGFTDFSISINAKYRISSERLKVALGEYITFSIVFPNFTIPTDDPLVSMENPDKEVIYLEVTWLSPGLYLVNHSTNGLSIGYYTITVVGKQQNLQPKPITLQLDVLQYWGTEINILVPPVIYPWNNISTFTIEYKCNEFPRENELLSGAYIHNVTLTRDINGTITPFLILSNSNVDDVWGWTDLGNGKYNIWFNTSIVSVTTLSVIYVIPYISYDVYRSATVEPYVWIRPVETQMSLSKSSTMAPALETIQMYLDQNITVFAFLRILDSTSNLNTLSLTGATIYFKTYQKQANNSISLYRTGVFAPEGVGLYSLYIFATDLGSYSVDLYAILENYTIIAIDFEYQVNLIPIIWSNKNQIKSVYSVPQNNDINFTFALWDDVHHVPLTGAIVQVNFDNRNFTFTGDDQGKYLINFSAAVLATFKVGTYKLEIQIFKANFTIEPIVISFNVGLPVDPYLHVPYMYWFIIGASTFAVSTVTITTRIVRNANIPLFIKQVQKTKKLIGKNKKITDLIITSSSEDEFLEKYTGEWEILGLNLKKIVGSK